MNQRSGRTSEKKFSLLCAEAGITCNESNEDDHGWDFIIEVPPQNITTLPADLAKPVQRVLVQIKSTKGSKPRTTFKVTNALNFSKAQMPCFVILFHTQADGNECIYATHFWETLIERSLKKARDISSKRKPLNQSKIQISFFEVDNHSYDLIEWIVRTVREFPVDYVSKKSKLAEFLGYDNESFRGEITFAPMKIDDLIDHQLGLSDTIDVLHLRIIDSRFGIEAREPLFEGTPEKVIIRSLAHQEIKLILQSQQGDIVTLPGNIIVPSIPGLPSDKLKIRIDTWMLSVVAAHGVSVDLSINMSMDEVMPVEHLCTFSKFICWSNEGKIDFSVTGDSLTIMHGHFNINKNGDEGIFCEFARIIGMFQKILDRAGATGFEFSFSQMFSARHDLGYFYDFMNSSSIDAKLEFFPNQVNDSRANELLCYTTMKVGDVQSFALLSAPVIEQNKDGDTLIFKFGKPILRDSYVGRQQDKVLSDGFASYERRVASSDLKKTLCIGDLNLWL